MASSLTDLRSKWADIAAELAQTHQHIQSLGLNVQQCFADAERSQRTLVLLREQIEDSVKVYSAHEKERNEVHVWDDQGLDYGGVATQGLPGQDSCAGVQAGVWDDQLGWLQYGGLNYGAAAGFDYGAAAGVSDTIQKTSLPTTASVAKRVVDEAASPDHHGKEESRGKPRKRNRGGKNRAGEEKPEQWENQDGWEKQDRWEKQERWEPKDGGGGSQTAAPKKEIVYPEGDEEYTTVMLRNIPNKYTREMLIKQLSLEYKGHFDFMYLPIDFKNKCNVGYGFINFRAQEYTECFVREFNGVDVRKCLPGLNSRKIVEVTPARVQGLHENVRRLRNSPVMNQLVDHPEWMPLLFNEQGQAEPFPNPDQPLPPVKPRGKNRDHARNIDLVET